MPDNVPVEDGEGRVSAVPAPSPQPHAWTAIPYWDAYVVAVLALMAVLALLDGSGWPHWASAGLLAAIAAAYLVRGRRLIAADDDSGAAKRWTAGYAALFIPAAVLVPMTSTALFALTPLAYMTAVPRWASAAVTAMLLAPPLLGQAVDPGPLRNLAVQLTVNTAILLFAMWFGGWINRIIAQSAERAALIRELEAGREQIAALSARTGAQAERERMAREIHDTLAQGFTSVITLAQAVQSEFETDPAAARRHLSLLLETGRENLAEARALVAGAPDGRSDGAAGGGAAADSGSTDAAGALEEALHRVAGRLSAETGAEVDVAVRGDRPGRMPAGAQVDLLRAAQESLANARRHSGAGAVRMVLEYTADTASVTVSDDGCGFTPGEAPGWAPAQDSCSGYGLRGLARRAEAAGGSFTIQSAPGAGTDVEFRLPLDPAGAAARAGRGTGPVNGAPQ